METRAEMDGTGMLGERKRRVAGALLAIRAAAAAA